MNLQHDRIGMNGRRGAAAFTLIEVLVAVVILATGIVLVLQALHGAVGVWEAAVERVRAAMLARDRLEEVVVRAADGKGDAPEPGAGRFDPPYRQYRWEMEVDRVALPGAAGKGGPQDATLHEVRCVVRREHSAREFQVATLVFMPPERREPPPPGEGGP